MLLLPHLLQTILEPLGEFVAPGIFLRTVADDVEPLRVVLVPNLPELLVELGDLLDRLTDKELERLADVLLLDGEFLVTALLDLAEILGCDGFERPVNDLIFVGRTLTHFLRHGNRTLGRLEVEQGIRLALAAGRVGLVDGEEAFADQVPSTASIPHLSNQSTVGSEESALKNTAP